jgi:hypothetical protein
MCHQMIRYCPDGLAIASGPPVSAKPKRSGGQDSRGHPAENLVGRAATAAEWLSVPRFSKASIAARSIS